MSETFATNELIEVAGIKLTKGALVVLIIGFALSIITTLALPHGWVAGLGILLLSFLTAYIQNCVVVGHCTVLAVVLLIFYIFNAISVIATVMISRSVVKSLKGKKLKK